MDTAARRVEDLQVAITDLTKDRDDSYYKLSLAYAEGRHVKGHNELLVGENQELRHHFDQLQGEYNREAQRWEEREKFLLRKIHELETGVSPKGVALEEEVFGTTSLHFPINTNLLLLA